MSQNRFHTPSRFAPFFAVALISLLPAFGFAQDEGGQDISQISDFSDDWTGGDDGYETVDIEPMDDSDLWEDDYIDEAGINLFGARDDRAPAQAGSKGARAMPGARRFGPASQPPVLIELFTSQGCSSCPPADAMLADLSTRKDVMALSYHVEYWDYLGWADDLAKPAFTKRQRAYAEALGQRGVYTPQMVLAGQDSHMDLRPADVIDRIERFRAAPLALGVAVQNEGKAHVIRLTPQNGTSGPMVIELVRYAPERKVRVAAGENRGRHMRYVNVVLDIQRLASWDGASPVRLTIRDGIASDDFPSDTRHVLLVQQVKSGGFPGRVLTTLPLD